MEALRQEINLMREVLKNPNANKASIAYAALSLVCTASAFLIELFR